MLGLVVSANLCDIFEPPFLQLLRPKCLPGKEIAANQRLILHEAWLAGVSGGAITIILEV